MENLRAIDGSGEPQSPLGGFGTRDRRLAFSLDAPWIAVNVDTGKLLNEQDQTTLTRNLDSRERAWRRSGNDR